VNDLPKIDHETEKLAMTGDRRAILEVISALRGFRCDEVERLQTKLAETKEENERLRIISKRLAEFIRLQGLTPAFERWIDEDISRLTTLPTEEP